MCTYPLLVYLQVAEQLYDVLASKAVSSRQMPVLLLANKSDCGAKAHSVEFIRKRLEKALDQLRTTRADVDAESGNVSVLLSVLIIIGMDERSASLSPGIAITPCIPIQETGVLQQIS